MAINIFNIKRWHLKKMLKEFIYFSLVLFFFSLILNYIRKPEVNETIYGLDLTTIKDKKLVMSHYKNRPLIVHFWATWCPTCKLEASNIEHISKEYNVITIAVNSGLDHHVLEYVQEHKLSFSVINDFDGKISKKFGITAFPTTFIYDSNGSLKFTEVGYTTTLGLQARLKMSN